MELNLWKYDGHPLQVNKFNSITTLVSVASINGHFKDNTSFKNPTFIISKRDTVNYNYVSIEYDGFEYFYSINDIVMVEDTQELICEIDVLHTFREYIYTITGMVERASYKNVSNYKTKSEDLFNNLIDDSEVLTTSVPLRSAFPKGGTTPIFTENDYNNNIYLTTTN